jgi:hypothetical protein
MQREPRRREADVMRLPPNVPRTARLAVVEVRSPPAPPARPRGTVIRRDHTVPEMAAVRRRFAAATILAALIAIAVLALVAGLFS